MFPLRCYFWVLCPGLWLPPASSSLLAAAQWRRGRRLEDFQAFNNHKVCVLSICVVVKYPFEGRIQTPFPYGFDGESVCQMLARRANGYGGDPHFWAGFVYKLKIPSDLRPSWGRKRAEYQHYCFRLVEWATIVEPAYLMDIETEQWAMIIPCPVWVKIF